MDLKLIIDRFEGDYAVCEKEDRAMVNVEKRKLPPEAKEGDVLQASEDKFLIDEAETIKRKKYIEELAKDLWQ